MDVKKHIVLTGARQIGKSTLVHKLLQRCIVPLHGFVTKATPRQPDGTHSVYLYSINDKEQLPCCDNHIGDACFGRRKVYPEVFDTLGLQLLSNCNDGLIIMDELGFMESEVTAFCQKVLQCFDGDIPILAVCKAKPGIEFVDQVKYHPHTALYTVTEDSRDALYSELLSGLISRNLAK